MNVTENAIVYNSKEHVSLILIKPFLFGQKWRMRYRLQDFWRFKYLSFVDMVVCTCVRATHDHDNKIIAGVQTEVVHWRFQTLSIIPDPMEKVEGGCEGHFRGLLSGYSLRSNLTHHYLAAQCPRAVRGDTSINHHQHKYIVYLDRPFRDMLHFWSRPLRNKLPSGGAMP